MRQSDFADNLAQRTQSSFLESDLAPIFQDEMTSGFVQFQNTINGLFNFAKLDILGGPKKLSQALMYAGTTAMLMGIYEALGLPHPDELSDFIPGFSTLREGTGPMQLTSAALNFNSEDPLKRAGARKKLLRGLTAIAVPGANQAIKSYQGIKAAGQGGKRDKQGRLQFKIGPDEAITSAVFGPYQTRGGRAYIKRGFKPEPMTDAERKLSQQKAAMKRRLLPR